jgi:serine/threonine protein kinase
MDNNDYVDASIMNNDFYNDDYYDYKNTFMRNKIEGEVKNHNYANQNYKEKINYLIDGENYNHNDDDDDDDENDENNDFTTGPLAIKRTSKQNKDQMNNYFYDGKHEKENYIDNFNDDVDNDQNDLMMMDTFFKRVDSLELSKPKKVKIINNYLIGEILGDGSYGKVKECLDTRSLARRAVKIINLKMVSRKIPRGIENVRKEINIMKRLDHRNVIKMYDIYEKGSLSSNLVQNVKNIYVNLPLSAGFARSSKSHIEDDQFKGDISCYNDVEITQDSGRTATEMVNIEKPPKIYIFMDYCMTSLERLLKNAPDTRLRNWQANYYFKQLIDGLEYLHSLYIIHNDIKPGNLLVTCDNTLKICDFSISAELSPFNKEIRIENLNQDLDSDDEKSLVRIGSEKESMRRMNDFLNGNNNQKFPILQCTPMFQCPEMLDENLDESVILKSAYKIDIWSSGITLYQLTTGVLPFQGQTVHQIFESIRSKSISFPDFIDKNIINLLVGMLDKNPLKRWSIKQIRDCEWFKKKHPIIKEELANFPQDVERNELSTFRMIQYLQKLCQTKLNEDENLQEIQPQYFTNEVNNNEMANTTLLMDRLKYTDINNQQSIPVNNNSNHLQENYQYIQNRNESQFLTQTNKNFQNQSDYDYSTIMANSNINTPVVNQSQQQEQFSQTAKAKRSHCSLM